MTIKNQEMNPKEKEEKNGEALRIDLNEEDTKRFRQLKKKLGIKNKSDVIRFCVNYTFNNYPNSKNH